MRGWTRLASSRGVRLAWGHGRWIVRRPPVPLANYIIGCPTGSKQPGTAIIRAPDGVRRREDVDAGLGIVIILVMAVAVFFMSRLSLGPKMRCTRCSGSGQINERWPDPNKPGGWHVQEGTCPKCKGKGVVSTR